MVNFFRRVFDFYLDASIHVALAVFCLAWLTGFFLDVSIDKDLAFFLFFGTIATYNFIKYGLEAEKYILVANRYHKNIQFLSLAALAFACYHAYFLKLNTWIGLGVLAILTGLYALPVLPKAKNLRSLSGFKIFPVALVWAGATVLLPIVQIDADISWDVQVEAVQRFLMVLALILPFEIRDLRFDAPDLQTIPQRYGIQKTKKIGIVLVVFLISMIFLKDNLEVNEIAVKAFIGITLIVALVLSEKKRSKYFASFWVELLPVTWFALTWVINNIT